MEMVVRKLRELDRGRLVLSDLIRLRATRTKVSRLSKSVNVKKRFNNISREQAPPHLRHWRATSHLCYRPAGTRRNKLKRAPRGAKLAGDAGSCMTVRNKTVKKNVDHLGLRSFVWKNCQKWGEMGWLRSASWRQRANSEVSWKLAG